MEFLHSFIRRHLAGKPVVASPNVGCFLRLFLCQLTANGSACSQEIGAPHDAGRIRSGRDSGTAIKMNKRSEAATNVAKATTALSSYIFPI